MTNPAPPQLIIFDCDGVLVDSELIANRVMAGVLAGMGIRITEDDCRTRFTGISMASVRALVEEELGGPLPDNFERLVFRADRIAFETDLVSVPGIDAALAAMPVRVCVASSGTPEKIANSLRVTHLAKYFENNIFSAAMVANGKPAPDLFLFAAKKMGVRPEHCVIIEDSISGVRAGVSAAMRVFGFNGASHALIDPDYGNALSKAGAETIFDDMAALPGLLGF